LKNVLVLLKDLNISSIELRELFKLSSDELISLSNIINKIDKQEEVKEKDNKYKKLIDDISKNKDNNKYNNNGYNDNYDNNNKIKNLSKDN